ncbi:MAG: HAD family hydrolase [Actinomycetota bacterium]|nr:HAD family hydrolase [Actinomycetota bacterium]
MTVRAVLFDFGNTLFAHAPLPETIRTEAAALGRPVTTEWARLLADRIQHEAHTAEELTHPRDLDAAVWAARWPVLYAVADDEVPGLGAALYRSMHAAHEWVPYAAAAHTLAALQRAGVPVGIVSNTGWDVRSVFAHHGMDEGVRSFVLSFEAGAVKPAVEIFELACQRVGSAPGETLMVGDDPVADAGAVRAGLTTLLLPALPPGAANGVDAVLSLVTSS